MEREVRISAFSEVKAIHDAAREIDSEIGVHDFNGSIADAKSLLGLMSLDYSEPVKIVSENERAVMHIIRMLADNNDWNKIFERLNPNL